MELYADNSEPGSDDFDAYGDAVDKIMKEVSVRPNQKRFAAGVFVRYGPGCAVCNMALPGVIEAAHLGAKSA